MHYSHSPFISFRPHSLTPVLPLPTHCHLTTCSVLCPPVVTVAAPVNLSTSNYNGQVTWEWWKKRKRQCDRYFIFAFPPTQWLCMFSPSFILCFTSDKTSFLSSLPFLRLLNPTRCWKQHMQPYLTDENDAANVADDTTRWKSTLARSVGYRRIVEMEIIYSSPN